MIGLLMAAALHAAHPATPQLSVQGSNNRIEGNTFGPSVSHTVWVLVISVGAGAPRIGTHEPEVWLFQSIDDCESVRLAQADLHGVLAGGCYEETIVPRSGQWP